MGRDETELFIPQNGGLGVLLTCTGTATRAAFPSPMQGSIFCVSNVDTDPVSLAFGDGNVVATTSYMMFWPGLTFIGIPNARGSGSPTHVSGITLGGTVRVQISAGTAVGAST